MVDWLGFQVKTNKNIIWIVCVMMVEEMVHVNPLSFHYILCANTDILNLNLMILPGVVCYFLINELPAFQARFKLFRYTPFGTHARILFVVCVCFRYIFMCHLYTFIVFMDKYISYLHLTTVLLTSCQALKKN